MSGIAHLSGRTAERAPRALFKPFVIFALVLIGLFAFSALLTLSGYADDLRQKTTGEASPLSRSAIGYAGVIELMGHLDYDVQLPRRLPNRLEARQDTQHLRIYTPASPYVEAKLDELSVDEVKLIILPKWTVEPLEGKRGWVRRSRYAEIMGTANLSELLDDLVSSDADALQVRRPDDFTYSDRYALENDKADDTEDGPPNVKIGVPVTTEITGEDFANEGTKSATIFGLQVFEKTTQDVILRANEHPVLVRIKGTKTYILSEPDLLNTAGISTKPRALLGLSVLGHIVRTEDLIPARYDFDLTLHGVGEKKNLIKLLTQPPFLAATLCLFFAGLLVAWQGFMRFGDPRPAVSGTAQGPAALANTAAEFMHLAGRSTHVGADYATLIRRSVAREMGLLGRPQKEIDLIVDAREKRREITPTFGTIARKMSVKDPTQFTAHARALVRWKEEMH